MLLEVCVDSLASARAAIAGGADRLELCSALALGGLTPYVRLLEQIRRESNIPIRCLMRPRPGDFLYEPEEILLMCHQMSDLKQAGANGFVIGCLTPGGDLDVDAMAPLIAAAEGCGLTLHRCVDVSRDPVETCRIAGRMGIDTVLTSGAAANCVDGADVLAQMLCLQASGGPEIMAGAGIHAGAIRVLLDRLTDIRAFHMSGKVLVESGMRFRRDDIPMGLPGLDEWHIQQTSRDSVAAAKAVIHAAGRK